MSDLKTARILVTGGDGFLGRHLQRELKERGASRVSAEKFSWRAKTDLKTGLRRTVEWYAEHIAGEAQGQSRADHHPRVRNRATAGS